MPASASTSFGPSFPAILVVIAILIAAGSALYRVSVARRIAERSGMDVGDATRVALLNDNAGSAAYLRSGIRQQLAAREPLSPVRTIQQRLADAEALQVAGTLTDEEYAASRARILDGL